MLLSSRRSIVTTSDKARFSANVVRGEPRNIEPAAPIIRAT